MKLLRRIFLALAFIVMSACLVLLRGGLPIAVPISERTLTWIGVAACGVALLLLFAELAAIMRSWRLPEPEDPPVNDKPYTPPADDDDPPAYKYMPPSTPTPPRSGKIVLLNDAPGDIEKAVKAVERAEDFVQHVNGRVKIELDVEDDDQGSS